MSLYVRSVHNNDHMSLDLQATASHHESEQQRRGIHLRRTLQLYVFQLTGRSLSSNRQHGRNEMKELSKQQQTMHPEKEFCTK